MTGYIVVGRPDIYVVGYSRHHKTRRIGVDVIIGDDDEPRWYQLYRNTAGWYFRLKGKKQHLDRRVDDYIQELDKRPLYR